MADEQKFKGITIREFEKMLATARKKLGPDATVLICVPYENGVGWKYEYAINCHAYSDNLDIPCTLNYRDSSHGAEPAKAR